MHKCKKRGTFGKPQLMGCHTRNIQEMRLQRTTSLLERLADRAGCSLYPEGDRRLQ